MKRSRLSVLLLPCDPVTLLLSILALSVLLRVGIAFYLGDVVDAPPLLTDQRSYHALGQRLVGGYGFSFETAWYPFTPANTPTSHWSFLYSILVAAVYAVFGAHPLAVRLVQAILGGILLPWMVYRLAKRLFPCSSAPLRHCFLVSWLPALAALLAAVYAYFVLYAATIMTETFYIVALLWSLERSLLLGHRLRDGERRLWPLALQLGVSLGVTALLRQSILPWVPVLFVWLLWQAWRTHRSNAQPLTFKLKPTILPLLFAAILPLLFILPFTIRNVLVYDDFLLLNSNTGYAMYSAQHPMHGTSFSEFAAAPLPDELRGLNEAQMDGELMRRGIQFVLDDPARYLLLSLSRVRAYFEFWPSPDTSLLHNIGRVGSFGLFLPFILYGLYLSIRNPQSAHFLIFAFVIFYSLLHIFTWAMVRYRLPIDAVLLPFAALALVDLFTRLQRRFPHLLPDCQNRQETQ